MSAAATELGITHGAVSRRIVSVEHWLGAPIFERLGRGVRLTEQGQVFVRRAERSMSALGTLRDELSSGRRRAIVRVSALPSMARLWLMPRLRQLEEKVGHGVEILSEHRLARLDERDADIAVRFGAGAWQGVDARLLFHDHVVPAASPELAHRLEGCGADDLLNHELIVDGDGAQWRQWCRLAGIQYKERGVRRRFLDYDLAVEAARCGMGVVLLRLPLASCAIDDGSLRPLNFSASILERAHYLVMRDGERDPRVLGLASAMLSMGEEHRA